MNTPNQLTIPTPSRSDRDSDGRLTGLCIDGGANQRPGGTL